MSLLLSSFIADNIGLIQSDKRIVLAYSGGLDSSVLLYLLANSINPNRLLIWHINHQLQICSSDMEHFCQQQVSAYQLPFKVSRLNLSQVSSNIESQARDARYEAFVNGLDPQSDILLTAHHADDQLETLLLNLTRGSGVLGLRGIAKKRIINGLACYRPLLSFNQEALKDFAKLLNIKWMDDPSNKLDCFDRNYVRHELTPKLKHRWPSIVQSFSQVASHQKEASECLVALALIDLGSAVVDETYSARQVLSIPKIRGLSGARHKNLLRYWLSLSSLSFSLGQMTLLLSVITEYDLEYKKVEFSQGFMALFNEKLYIVLDDDIASSDKIEQWLNNYQEDNVVGRINKDALKISSHFLKRQFQAASVPPWLRDQTFFKLNSNGSKHNLEVIVL